MNESCTCPSPRKSVFRPALSSPADRPVLVRVCVACDLPILGHGQVVTTTTGHWQVFQRKASTTLLRVVRYGRRIHS